MPLVVGPVSFGTLRGRAARGPRPLAPHEQLLLEAPSKQAAAALDRARLDARARLAQVDAETNQLRAPMFSSVTHDLRTPLASIKAGVTSLLDGACEHDPMQERELLTTILEETDRLNRLVGNILDLAKIRAGALIPRRSEAGARRGRGGGGRAALAPTIDGSRVELESTDDVPSVAADPMQLDQVLTNLLENAARHSPPEAGSTVGSHLGVDPARRADPRDRSRAPASPGMIARRSSRRSTVGIEPPETPGPGWGSRSRRRS